MNVCEDRPLRKIWSKTERETLLNLLKAEGHTNYERIAQGLPNKSVSAVRSMINKYAVLAKSLKPGIVDPLDYWLHSYFSSETEKIIPQALLFIRLFEDHPTIEETNGVDIGAIYEFIYRSILGQSISGIPPETWKAFTNEMTVACNYVTNASEREVLTYLSTLNAKQKPLRDYSRKNSD